MLNTLTSTFNDNWIEVLGMKRERVPVLIIGNNPIEMTCIHDVLIGIRSKSYVTDFCFNLKDSFYKIEKTQPAVILIDDNLMADEIKKYIKALRLGAKTKNAKIILLKSSAINVGLNNLVDAQIYKSEINADSLSGIIEKNIHVLVQQLA